MDYIVFNRFKLILEFYCVVRGGRSSTLLLWNANRIFEVSEFGTKMLKKFIYQDINKMDGGAMSSRRLLLTVAVAFVIGGALKDFFSAFTSSLATPVIASLFPGVQQTVYGLEIQVAGVKLEVGKVVSATVTLLVSLLIVSVTLPYIKAYAPIQGAKRS
jgi:large-conductance mechanosensitive channel